MVGLRETPKLHRRHCFFLLCLCLLRLDACVTILLLCLDGLATGPSMLPRRKAMFGKVRDLVGSVPTSGSVEVDTGYLLDQYTLQAASLRLRKEC